MVYYCFGSLLVSVVPVLHSSSHFQMSMSVRNSPTEDVITIVLALMVATTVLVMMDIFLEMMPPVVLVRVIHCVWLIVTVVIQISMNVKLTMEDVHKHVITLKDLISVPVIRDKS